MVHATVRANPRLGGGIQSFDASAADEGARRAEDRADADGVGVIADNTWRAFQAAAMVNLDVGPGALPGDDSGPVRIGGRFVHRRTARTAACGRRRRRCRAASGAGGAALQAEYRVPYLAHAPLEPMNAVVQLKDGRLDIWTGTQIPRLRGWPRAAALSGLDENDHPPARADQRRQFRPPAGGRLRAPGGAAGHGAPGRADQDDLDARRRHDARLPAPAGHRAAARRRQRASRCTPSTWHWPARRSPPRSSGG